MGELKELTGNIKKKKAFIKSGIWKYQLSQWDVVKN